jgi:hypothetical protein
MMTSEVVHLAGGIARASPAEDLKWVAIPKNCKKKT